MTDQDWGQLEDCFQVGLIHADQALYRRRSDGQWILVFFSPQKIAGRTAYDRPIFEGGEALKLELIGDDAADRWLWDNQEDHDWSIYFG